MMRLGAFDFLRRRADVDSSRLAVYGHSFGGILSVLAAELDLGARAVVAAAPAAQNWAGAADLRDALMRAVRNAESGGSLNIGSRCAMRCAITRSKSDSSTTDLQTGQKW